jgi:hypothetical protein
MDTEEIKNQESLLANEGASSEVVVEGSVAVPKHSRFVKPVVKSTMELPKDSCSLAALFDTFGGLPPLQYPRPPWFVSFGLGGDLGTQGSSSTSEEAESNNKKRAKKQQPVARLPEMKAMADSVTEWMETFEANLKDSHGYWLLSMIAVSLPDARNSEATLSNFNLACIRTHVQNVLTDVLKCLHLSSARVGMEISTFAMRPDVLVVRWMSMIILVIEVEHPTTRGYSKSAVSTSIAAKTCYGHAMGVHQMGLDHPFVILTTYNHMCIGTIADPSCEIFKRAAELLNSGGGTALVGTGSLSLKQENAYDIPDKAKHLLWNVPDNSLEAPAGEEEEDEKGWIEETLKTPDFYFSEIFDRTNMFKALYFAVVCGIVAVEASGSDQCDQLVPKEGEHMDRCVNVVTTDDDVSLYWKKLKCTATYSCKTRWNARRTESYLHCVLNRGGWGKVYLASDSSGRMYALKLYLAGAKLIWTNDEDESDFDVAMRIRDKAAGRWKALYPSYKEAVFAGKSRGVPSLAMPFVASVPAHRRLELLPKVRAELNRFADHGYSYKYKMYWHHVGLRKDKTGEEHIILVGLESLHELVEPHAAAAKIADNLEGYVDTERNTIPQGLIHIF